MVGWIHNIMEIDNYGHLKMLVSYFPLSLNANNSFRPSSALANCFVLKWEFDVNIITLFSYVSLVNYYSVSIKSFRILTYFLLLSLIVILSLFKIVSFNFEIESSASLILPSFSFLLFVLVIIISHSFGCFVTPL